MSMTFTNQLAVIPALLIALLSLIVWGVKDSDKKAHRFLIYVMSLVVLLLSSLLVTKLFITQPYNQPVRDLSNLLVPSLLALVALILLNVNEWSGMSWKTRIVVIVLGLAILTLFGLLWDDQLGLGYLILPGALILAMGWALARRYHWLTIGLSAFSLLMLFLILRLMNHPPDYNSYEPRIVLQLFSMFALYVTPGLTVVLAAMLIIKSLPRAKDQGENGGMETGPRIHWSGIFLAFILVLLLSYVIYWGSVWDQTNDGLFGIFFLQFSAPIAVGAGIMMVLSLRGKERLAGFLFILIAPLALYQSFEAGWRVSYQEITDKRAERITQALDNFHAREGYYPASLEILTPRDLILIQQPVILAGETWCYESAEEYYRLSAFYREFFSAPVSLRVYGSAGSPPASLKCEERLAEMKEKYYSPMEDPSAMRPPLPTAMPDIEVGMPKIEIKPLLDGVAAILGSWSPDGEYFVFATQENGLSLHFLIGETGDVCTSDKQFSFMESLRNHYIWLPDGRLLHLDSSGEVRVLTPCQLGGEDLTASLPEMITAFSSYSSEQDSVLLKSTTAYWILDTTTFSSLPIPEVTPNPYELHWDTFAWLPGSNHLVIARLNGRKGSNAGTTLFLINGHTGQVENQLDLAGEFYQSAPWMEGLSETELLVHANGKLSMVNFKQAPPQTLDVLKETFGLDIQYPDDVSAAGSYLNPSGDGYYLAVRLNHPRNQSTYLYRSQDERVYVYDHEYHTLLLFPDGYLMEMSKLELTPTYQDQYDIIMVDAPETAQPRLQVTGHTPREDPHLNLAYLAETSQIAIASAHGVSLVSLNDGTMLSYWTLSGGGYSPWVIPAPDSSVLVAAKDFGGLYYIRLFPGQ